MGGMSNNQFIVPKYEGRGREGKKFCNFTNKIHTKDVSEKRCCTHSKV